MDPVTTTAILGLVGKVIGIGADLYKNQGASGESAVALGTDGSAFVVNRGDRFAFGSRFDYLEPVPLLVDFVPEDEWAAEALSDDLPALVVIEDLNPRSPLDSVTEVSALGGELEGALYPSEYALTVFVFSSDDPDDWDEDDLIGGGHLLFSVEPDDELLQLRIAIESFESPSIFEVGHIERGGIESYAIELEAGETYSVFVDPDDERADLDLTIRDENGNIVDQDLDEDSAALCEITPAWTGSFELIITCSERSTDYVLMISLDD